MKLRLIHSCMVLGVLALLFCYSAFLTVPQFTDENSLTTGDAKRVDGAPGEYDLLNLQPPPAPPQPLTVDISKLAPPVVGQESPKEYGSQSQSPNINSDAPPPPMPPWTPTVEGGRRKESEQKRDIGGLTLHDLPPSEPQVPPTQTKMTTPSQAPPTFPPTRAFYDPGFSYPNPAICPNDGEDIRLLILIMSAPTHFSAREAIRLTWAHYGQRSDISIAFLIGRTSNETAVEGMEIEKHLYDDLIIANFADSYDNLTLKTMGMLEWIETYCNQSQFILKTDDDMFISVPNVLNFINRIEVEDAKEGKIYGRLAKKWKPVRNKKSKYYISFQQYKKTVYPDFTTGPAYLFPTRLASRLLEKGLDNTYLKLEDVYTTGIVAQQLGIKRVNVGDFANKKVNFHKTGFCALSHLVSMHMVAFHEQFELWKKLLDGRTKCKIVYQTKPKIPTIVSKKSSETTVPGATSRTIPTTA